MVADDIPLTDSRQVKLTWSSAQNYTFTLYLCLSNNVQTQMKRKQNRRKKEKEEKGNAFSPWKNNQPPKQFCFRYTERNGTAASQGKQLIQLLPTFSCRMNTVQELVPWANAKTTISDMVKTLYWPKTGGVFVVYHYVSIYRHGFQNVSINSKCNIYIKETIFKLFVTDSCTK